MTTPKPTPPPTIAAVYLKERDEINYQGFAVRVDHVEVISAGRIQLRLIPLGPMAPPMINTSVPASTIFRKRQT